MWTKVTRTRLPPMHWRDCAGEQSQARGRTIGGQRDNDNAVADVVTGIVEV